jgi:hypothetical protein
VVAKLAIAKPAAGGSAGPKPVAVAGDALSTLKSITKSLKSTTAQIPQQAILHKTGIIAAPAAAELTDAQKQAAKSKTSRISLSEAVGAAPVKNDGAPMKTIRIKRPVDLPTGAPSAPVAATAKIVAPPPAAGEAAPAAAPAADVTATQRKTLKIARPGGGAVRPAGKFGIKKPGAPAAPAAAAAPAAPADAGVADIPDIPDMPAVANIPAFPPAAAAADTVSDVPAFVATLGVIVQVAACVAIGALAWFLYQDNLIPLF